MADEKRSITLEEVTEAAMSGAMRAMEARQSESDFPWSSIPIVIGIVMNPIPPILESVKASEDVKG